MNTWTDWVAIDALAATMTVATTAALYLSIIAFVRITGLRSFSKMSAFDFAMTLAIGSLFASAISKPEPTITVALVAFASLFAGQKAIAIARRSPAVKRAVDNEPILLMRRGQIIEANLRACNVTAEDVRSKLREANALSLASVHAVVFETTGDVTVLHGDPDSPPDPWLLEGVREAV